MGKFYFIEVLAAIFLSQSSLAAKDGPLVPKQVSNQTVETVKSQDELHSMVRNHFDNFNDGLKSKDCLFQMYLNWTRENAPLGDVVTEIRVKKLAYEMTDGFALYVQEYAGLEIEFQNPKGGNYNSPLLDRGNTCPTTKWWRP